MVGLASTKVIVERRFRLAYFNLPRLQQQKKSVTYLHDPGDVGSSLGRAVQIQIYSVHVRIFAVVPEQQLNTINTLISPMLTPAQSSSGAAQSKAHPNLSTKSANINEATHRAPTRLCVFVRKGHACARRKHGSLPQCWCRSRISLLSKRSGIISASGLGNKSLESAFSHL